MGRLSLGDTAKRHSLRRGQQNLDVKATPACLDEIARLSYSKIGLLRHIPVVLSSARLKRQFGIKMIGEVMSTDASTANDKSGAAAENGDFSKNRLRVEAKQMDLTSFFNRRPSLPLKAPMFSTDDEASSTKRVKSTPLSEFPEIMPMRAPSPVILSPTKVREIEQRKQEALQRMEAKRVARMCDLERRCLGPSWLNFLEEELTRPYFLRLKEFLQGERDRGTKIFPPEEQIYSWSQMCTFDSVNVVILGQDPYHNDGQAMGLAFSVPEALRPYPPSLLNMYKELAQEYPNGEFKMPNHGCLKGWAKQGVLLLNASLTVRSHEAASHSGRGWEAFTDKVVQLLATKHQNLVFLLWGNHAQKKGAFIDKHRHCILTAAHPSPLSANRGFFGCGHFRKANEYLQEHGKSPINWSDL